MEQSSSRKLTLSKIAAVYISLGIVAGAFGAHALKDALEPALLATYSTASHYLLTVSIAILAVLGVFGDSRHGCTAAVALLIGVTIFSGSLFLLVGTGIRTFGAITPIGGTIMIGAFFSFVFYRPQNDSRK